MADKNERERKRYTKRRCTRAEGRTFRDEGGGGEGVDRGEKGQGEQGSDSGPVINEESNFQAGDLTSSRPTVAATQCEMEHETVVGARKR